MNIREAIDSIPGRELAALSGVSRTTITTYRDRNALPDSKAGRNVRRVLEERCGLPPLDEADRPVQGDLPMDDPINVKLDRARLANAEAAAAEKQRKNAEAESRLLPADEVAAKVGHAGALLRTVIDGVRREMEAQLPEDIREAILETYDAGFTVGIGAVTKAWEGG